MSLNGSPSTSFDQLDAYFIRKITTNVHDNIKNT